jgi:hypothetical protein
MSSRTLGFSLENNKSSRSFLISKALDRAHRCLITRAKVTRKRVVVQVETKLLPT